MSFKRLFSRAFAAAPGRLHLAAHSHHLWPDSSFDGQLECWQDAALLADRKWNRIMGEVWPEAQRYVARELGTYDPNSIVFASNTHELLVRLVAAVPRRDHGQLRILTSDGEFHSARRQFARWEESGECIVTRVESDPFETFPDRFMEAAMAGGHDLIFISQVMFGSGRCFDRIERLAALSLPGGPWVVIDGYHAFMAIPELFGAGPAASTFYLGGGYKYAMAGEGCAFLHAPPDFGPRPPVTGWYAEIERLDGSSAEVAYPEDGFRFIGATFDASGLYRFNAVQRMLEQNDLSTARVSEHVRGLQVQLLDSIRGTVLAEADLLNPLGNEPHARFLAFRDARAAGWRDDLARENCIVDVRGNVLRIGLGLYHDSEDIAAFAALAGRLQ